MVSRRQTLKLLGASSLLGLGGLPRALAATEDDRKFLFLLAYGGWDPMYVMAPSFDHAHLHHPDDSWYEDSAPLPHVAGMDRPTTSRFLDDWGHLGCIVNGIEVPSITHEQCRRLILTGAPDGRVDDWAAILGGTSTGFDLPTVVASGPAYGARYTSTQLRLGPDGQLGALVSGEALDETTLDVTPPSAASQDAVQAWLAERQQRWIDQAPPGSADFAQGLANARTQTDRLATLGSDVDLSVPGEGFIYCSQRVEPLLELMERGLTRAGAAVHLGQWDANWDTHSNATAQAEHFEFLFSDLELIFLALERRGLLDTTTVVVLSEMGRAPVLNSLRGKDHWTFTSAMLFGSGIQGGQVVGGFDDQWAGTPVDGRTLTTNDLGATLMTLGGLDPAEHGVEGSPITQVLA